VVRKAFEDPPWQSGSFAHVANGVKRKEAIYKALIVVDMVALDCYFSATHGVQSSLSNATF
jgi:hypothetical protein